MRTNGWMLAALLCLAGGVTRAVSQVSLSDYERAGHVAEKYRGTTIDLPGKATWMEGEDRFWYRKSVADGGHVFIVVDAQKLEKKAAFDHEKLAASLSTLFDTKITPEKLPFSEFHYAEKNTALEFTANDSRVSCTLSDYKCTRLGAVVPWWIEEQADDETAATINRKDHTRVSPDGKWEALILNYNVYLRKKGSKDAPVVLSMDGSEGNFYSFNSLEWSPDSKHLVDYRIRPGYRREVHFVESSPEDQLQPKYPSIVYAKPGDVLDLQQPVLFDIEAKRQIEIANDLFPNPYELSHAQWRKDSHAFTFEYNQRGHQFYRIVEVDAGTGKAHALITEQSTTFIEYLRLPASQYDTGKIYRYDVDDGKELIWMSERDGWAHLYLFDGMTGKLKSQITKGDWVVRSVDRVDEAKRQIYFEASGKNPGMDPYFVQAYRINFDGSGLTALTSSDANHSFAYSSDGKYYVDTWSRVDLAPKMELRSVADNRTLMELEQAKLDRLQAAGWKAPESFHALGRDGKTDIWGVIYRPMNFDTSKKYPVVEDIYAGPQGSFVPKSFSERAESLTELGFVVVQIDGMGTNNRSKSFHDVIFQNLKDGGFEDRILWHKAVAAKYPWYDISRVGIFGTSAGGQNAMAALLFHPEFYKAAVANSGCHDNRMDKIWWNEQWMGWPVGPQYAASSNVDNAYRLKGKLLLVVGETDHNVDPSSTFQVANALIKANKKFDLLYVPGGDHGAGGDYGQKVLFDFFVHNLMGQEPPDWSNAEKK